MAAQTSKPKTSGETVTVACKLPNGLVLRNYEMVDFDEPILGGGKKTTKRAIAKGEPFTINGTALNKGDRPEYLIVGGYALTPGVPKDLFDAWLKANKDSKLVKSNLIFANPTENDARDESKEKKAIRSGLEPIVPNSDSRIPRGPQKITTAETKEE